jgi:hypothetical protein
VPPGLCPLGHHDIRSALYHEDRLLDGRDHGDHQDALRMRTLDEIARIPEPGAQDRHPLFKDYLELLRELEGGQPKIGPSGRQVEYLSEPVEKS